MLTIVFYYVVWWAFGVIYLSTIGLLVAIREVLTYNQMSLFDTWHTVMLRASSPVILIPAFMGSFYGVARLVGAGGVEIIASGLYMAITFFVALVLDDLTKHKYAVWAVYVGASACIICMSSAVYKMITF